LTIQFKRQQIHKLVDKANEHQLDAVLEILTQHTSLYTQEEINSLYNLVKLFEEGGSKGSSVTEAHVNISNKYRHKHGE
jgi:hypothetical protein